MPGQLAGSKATRIPRANARRSLTLALASLLAMMLLIGCSPTAAGTSLVVYSGRQEILVGPLMDLFAKTSGVNIQIRYGDTAELAATILEEGSNSPADVFFSQDAGALGALAQRDMLATLPDDFLNRVNERFRSPAGKWVGTTARARVVAYNT
jgi:iron(III) transport system substrate-binding protein